MLPLRMFLMTANVGSVFENLEGGLDLWMAELSLVIRSKDPEFVAIHFQETGGKDYQNGSTCIGTFFGRLVEVMGQLKFRRGEGFVDSRSDLEHQFTALSNVYFVHESVPPHAVNIWDFQGKCFKDVPSPPKIHTGPELDQAFTKEKEKFPQNFFPNCKWSRKGFIRARFQISGKIMDLVNIHLFHDSNNVIAASSFPSEFAESRKNALQYTLKRLQNSASETFPFFIFGDFNFRLNTHGVLSHLRKEVTQDPIILSAKKFHCPDHERLFLHSHHWLKEFEFELQHHKDSLDEFDFNFHPTYPFQEDLKEPEKFLRTRCPAWCDRVLFTHRTKDIISQESPTEYNIMGQKTCMGDHKPVFLSFTLANSIPPYQNSCDHHHQCKPPHQSSSAVAEGVSSNPLACQYEYRMTLTPKSTCPENGECSKRRGKKCHHKRSFVSLLLSFHSCKKSSVSSDSVYINPPSSQSEENESSVQTIQNAPTPQQPSSSPSSSTKKFPRNVLRVFKKSGENVCLDKNNVGTGSGHQIIQPSEPLIVLTSKDQSPTLPQNNRIIMPLMVNDKDIIGVDIQDLYHHADGASTKADNQIKNKECVVKKWLKKGTTSKSNYNEAEDSRGQSKCAIL